MKANQTNDKIKSADNNTLGNLSTIKEESELLDEDLSMGQISEIESVVDGFLGKFTKEQKAQVISYTLMPLNSIIKNPNE